MSEIKNAEGYLLFGIFIFIINFFLIFSAKKKCLSSSKFLAIVIVEPI
jgi:hypothetical protein